MTQQQTAQRQRAASLKIALPNGDVEERGVTKAASYIGRGLHNDIPIIDQEVLATHALLVFSGGDYFLLSEESGAVTFVNGERVTIPKKLSHGDIIKIGKSEIAFALAPDPEALAARLGQATSLETAVEPETWPEDRESKEVKEKKKHKKEEGDAVTDYVAGAKALSDDPGSEVRYKAEGSDTSPISRILKLA